MVEKKPAGHDLELLESLEWKASELVGDLCFSTQLEVTAVDKDGGEERPLHCEADEEPRRFRHRTNKSSHQTKFFEELNKRFT